MQLAFILSHSKCETNQDLKRKYLRLILIKFNAFWESVRRHFWAGRVQRSMHAAFVWLTSNLIFRFALWFNGFEIVENFWLDKWRDGSVQLNPQMAQCDDGNNKSGDGWSKDCYIEGGYSWDIITNLDNKSYWYNYFVN